MASDPRVRTTPEPDYGGTLLAEELADLVSHARQLNTDLGLRPYRVLAIRQHWTGGQVGRGDVCEVQCLEVLPRPKVELRTRRELTAGGMVERGTAQLSEIDPRLTEAELLDLFAAVPLGPADEAYLEIRPAREQPGDRPRRWVVAEPPERRPFEWRVALRPQDGARALEGALHYPGRR